MGPDQSTSGKRMPKKSVSSNSSNSGSLPYVQTDDASGKGNNINTNTILKKRTLVKRTEDESVEKSIASSTKLKASKQMEDNKKPDIVKKKEAKKAKVVEVDDENDQEHVKAMKPKKDEEVVMDLENKKMKNDTKKKKQKEVDSDSDKDKGKKKKHHEEEDDDDEKVDEEMQGADECEWSKKQDSF